MIFSNVKNPELIRLLNESKVGILPTDTLYGLVCRAADQTAVQRVYRLKQRENKPGTIIAASIDQLVTLGFKARYLKAVSDYWPGAVSIVIPCIDLSYLHQGVGSVAVRISADKTLNTLIDRVGPLLTSSANLPGEAVADTITQAQNYFGDTVDFYVDGGDLSGRLPSTILRVVDDELEVLREGAVKI
jgi:L-threonylcarbamoyladenylate synthase